MKRALIVILAATALLGQSADESQATDPNVNSRYTVESIGFTGQRQYRLSSSALEEIQHLIGEKLNTDALNNLIRSVRDELRAHDVSFKLVRGGSPDSVKVLLEVSADNIKYNLSIPKFAYTSRQGWTGIGDASATIANDNKVTLGFLIDGDSLAERFGGFQVRYDRLSLGTDRIHLGFEFDGYHDQYNRATLAALDNASSETSSLGAGAYRSRVNFEPSATFVLAKPLTLTVGLSFEQLEPQSSAARSVAANAVVNTLRYHRHWQTSDATKQDLEAGYNLRAATKLLSSDLGYTRHAVNVHYAVSHDQQSVEVALVAGVIYGQAPLFERFVLGNSSTLRGWNKYDLDPLGGNRMVHGSVTYGYHIMRVFYDTGAIWDEKTTPEAKHSVGVGVSSGLGIFQKGAFLLAVAFPLRQGRMDPVFIAGMNF
jgi:hemolysin activation/secretion protein